MSLSEDVREPPLWLGWGGGGGLIIRGPIEDMCEGLRGLNGGGPKPLGGAAPGGRPTIAWPW